VTRETHLTEGDLTLHVYGESDDPPAADAHLRDCAACRAAFEALRAALAAAEVEEPPARGDDYGARVWQTLAPRLEFERRRALRRKALARRLVAWGTLAASLLAAFLLGRRWPAEVGPTPAPVEIVRERILLVALGRHLDRSHMLLIELANAPAGGTVNVASERRSAEELVEANRIYRRTAARAGESALVSVLDELERLLAEVANGPDELASGELERLRERIEARGLLFKVRVLGSQVERREKSASPAEGVGVS
jgi:hypothetical protein